MTHSISASKIRALCGFLGTALIASWLPAVAHACPMCFNGDSQNGDAFLYGSLFLMFVPTVCLGGLGYWAYKRIKAAETASEPPPNDAGAPPPAGPVVLRVVERQQ
jgi:hypothetical protein